MTPCPLCGSDDLLDYHDRRAAACGGCGALERQRALARGFARWLARGARGRCLEIAPLNRYVFGGFLRARGWQYESVDKRRLREPFDPGGFDGFIDHDLDLTDLRGLGSGSYRLILLQHVLEEIRDYRAGLDEIARVLASGGAAILEIPWDGGLAATEHKGPDRYDNRWRFGADLGGELRARFADVSEQRLAEGRYKGTFFLCRAA